MGYANALAQPPQHGNIDQLVAALLRGTPKRKLGQLFLSNNYRSGAQTEAAGHSGSGLPADTVGVGGFGLTGFGSSFGL